LGHTNMQAVPQSVNEGSDCVEVDDSMQSAGLL